MKINLTKINKNIKLNTNIDKINEYIEDYTRELNKNEKKIKSFKIDNITYKTIKEKYKVENIQEIENELQRDFVINYFVYKNKIATLTAIKAIVEVNGILKPELYLNKEGTVIKCKNHSFNYLKEEEIRLILNFDDSIKFENTDDLEAFIVKYFGYMVKNNEFSTYFIRNNELYFNLTDITPLSSSYRKWDLFYGSSKKNEYDEYDIDMSEWNFFFDNPLRLDKEEMDKVKDRNHRKRRDFIFKKIAEDEIDYDTYKDLIYLLKEDDLLIKYGTILDRIINYDDYTNQEIISEYNKSVEDIKLIELKKLNLYRERLEGILKVEDSFIKLPF